jgi:hypothetical protein
LTLIRVKFFRIAVGYILSKPDEEILEHFKVEPVEEKLRRYKSNWLRHVTRTNSNSVPKIMLKY